MYRASRVTGVLGWVRGHLPRNQVQLEKELRSLLRIIFWVVLLAPVVILPLYYLILALSV